MGCDCGKPKCDGSCGISPAVLQINNPSECVYFHRVEVPASMGDSKTNPPKNGAYKNVLLYYEADQTSWLYDSDGIPQKLVNGVTNYEDAINLPQINGVTLLGDKTSSQLGIKDLFYINVTDVDFDEGTFTADKTYAEILEAYNAGKLPIVIVREEDPNLLYNGIYMLRTYAMSDEADGFDFVNIDASGSEGKVSTGSWTIHIGYNESRAAESYGRVEIDSSLNQYSNHAISNSAVANALLSRAVVFDTVVDMKAATNLGNGSYARTLGYTSLDDGGGALYIISNSNDTVDNGSVIALDSGLQAHLISDTITPEMFGAVCDGTHDDSTALNNTFRYAVNASKEVRLLEKTYTIGSHSQYYFKVHITGDCTVTGAGKDKSIIAVKSDIGGLAHVLNLDHAGNVALSGFTVDGGIDISDPAYEDDVFCAGIRLDDTDYVTIKDVAVRNTSGYGISLAQGSTQRLVIEDVVVENTGRDGIDTKNFDDANGVFTINNVLIKNVGLHMDQGADQTGLDVRCYAANISNIRCEDMDNATSGIRARITTAEQGTGGEYNNLSNIVCVAKSTCTGEGIAINAVGCNIDNVAIKGFNVGIRVTKDNVRINNAYISDCLVSAIRQDADGLTVSNVCCEKINNTTWAMLDVRIGTMMATNVVFGNCAGAVGVADGTVGVYLCNCYLKGTPSVRFAFGSLANRTGKIHTNSTCSNITIT